MNTDYPPRERELRISPGIGTKRITNFTSKVDDGFPIAHNKQIISTDIHRIDFGFIRVIFPDEIDKIGIEKELNPPGKSANPREGSSLPGTFFLSFGEFGN